jgi:hypothetical protein
MTHRAKARKFANASYNTIQAVPSRLIGGAKARLLYRYVGDNEKTYKDNLDNQHFSCPRAKNQRRTLHRNSRFPSGVTG